MLKPELKKLLDYNREGLKASDRHLKRIYYYTFSHPEKIMCEGHDGLRTYTYTYAQMDRKIRTAAAGLHAKAAGTVALRIKVNQKHLFSSICNTRA